jgi:ketosteroid isomerase-like protein
VDQSTEARLARALDAADAAEVRAVIARLAQLADTDTDDFEEYLSLWAEDAVTVHPTDTAHGHAEILARSRELRRRAVQGPGTDSMHVITTQWVRVEGDEATSRSYWLFYGRAGEPSPELRAMGAYDDTLVRTAGGWKLRRRLVSHGVDPART